MPLFLTLYLTLYVFQTAKVWLGLILLIFLEYLFIHVCKFTASDGCSIIVVVHPIKEVELEFTSIARIFILLKNKYSQFYLRFNLPWDLVETKYSNSFREPVNIG